MPNKDRLLVLLHTLQNNSDDETWLTTQDLRSALEKEGFECSIRTLRRDVQSLHNCGYDIAVQETEGMYTKYAYLSRKLSMPDLQILVDAVSAAQFIPQKRSEELVAELASMAGPSHVQELKPQILVSEHVKAKNKNMIYAVQEIRRAIDRNKKIRFRYLEYNTEKKQTVKHEGTEEEWYVVSPYATVWNDDRYYLVGWSDKRSKVTVFRIDRMEVPKQLPNNRVPEPEDFDVRDYTDKVFRMYGGPEEKVTLRCSMEILDQVIDRFGDRIEIKAGKKHFTVTVPVSLSTTFYAWVFQYVGKMSILSPEYVREAYAGYLEEALDDVLGED
ncbi:MAG: WYL domain-containing protein [Clostridia bacterium]|nr:WYL domain-containing protein [Clostridia bacterium]